LKPCANLPVVKSTTPRINKDRINILTFPNCFGDPAAQSRSEPLAFQTAVYLESSYNLGSKSQKD
jgi:hypothetical protein